jgi:ribosomal protein S18 acetylase RimI-like enzyme
VKKGKMSQEQMDEDLESFVAGREIYPGRNCKQGWGVHLLMKMAIRTLKLDYPDSFKKTDSESTMRKLVRDDKYLGKGNKKESPIYTNKEIDELDNEDLRRSLYWSTRRTGGYITNLCKGIEDWFRTTKWEGLDMLIPDKQAGTAGGHKKIVTKQVSNKQDLRLEKVIPIRNQDKFKTYFKDIQNLMNECFSIKKYVPDIDDKIWVMVFSRKKLVGFLAIDNENVIWNVCVATNYRRRGMAKQAIQMAVSDVCSKKSPRLLLDNRGKNHKKLFKLYTDYGFTLVKNDGKNTTMEFKCV